MPELPEVETIVKDLNTKVLNRTFVGVWTDTKKYVKKPASFSEFEKQIKGKKIIKIWRRAKNIIFELSENLILLVHQKMSGHLLYGKWVLKNNKWEPAKKGIMEDRVNTYIHLLFYLDNGFMLALSDLRKFAKVELWDKQEFLKSKDYNELGPEPLEKSFTFEKFTEIFKNKKGKIKQVLMDPKVIAGIGNIYADEILWYSKIHPLRSIVSLKGKELKSIYKNIKKVLEAATKLRGTSISDFRDTSGELGAYGEKRKAYQREGEKCYRCGTIIIRIKIGGRSACFCPNCQKI